MRRASMKPAKYEAGSPVIYGTGEDRETDSRMRMTREDRDGCADTAKALCNAEANG